MSVGWSWRSCRWTRSSWLQLKPKAMTTKRPRRSMTRMKINRAAAKVGGRILRSMKTFGTFRLFAGKTLLVCCALMLGAAAIRVVPAVAQQRGPVQRVVQGKVTDKSDAAIKGAVVYLKD